MKKKLLAMLSALLVFLLCFTPCGHAAEEAEPSFSVLFMDVGQADAALVLCDGEALLIDGGNGEDAGLIRFYLQLLSIDRLSYVVRTHPHEDHLGGLPEVLSAVTAEHALCPVDSMEYVLNTNTHKFHYPSCSSVSKMSNKNKSYYEGTRDEVIAMGYDPCKRCHP